MRVRYLPGEKVNIRGVIRDVYKTVGRAIGDHAMLKDGDKILAAVSGGIDSLAMLKLLLLRRRHIPIKINILACFVDMDFVAADKAAVIKYFQDEGVEYVVKPLSFAGEKMSCFWCSWNRRKALFETAREHGCNKIALGHHLDDIAQTVLMNMFFKGEISTAPANLEMFGGKVSLIRPMCYVEKKDLREFARNFAFPADDFVCPYGKGSQREIVGKIIAGLEEKFPYVKKNITRSLARVKEGYLA